MLVVVLGLFALPFLTVGCVPTQYGSQSAGGSTDYTGYQLALGLDPTRGTENLLPPADWLPDRVGLQGLVLAALVLVAVALVASFVVTDPRTRRLAVAVTAGLAAVLLVAGVAVARSALVALVTGQLGDQVLEEGRTAADHVGSGPGYVLSLAALLVLTAVEGVLLALAARRARARPALDSTGPGG